MLKKFGIALVFLLTAGTASAACNYYCYVTVDTASCYEVISGPMGVMADCSEEAMCYRDPGDPSGPPLACYYYCRGSECHWT